MQLMEKVRETIQRQKVFLIVSAAVFIATTTSVAARSPVLVDRMIVLYLIANALPRSSNTACLSFMEKYGLQSLQSSSHQTTAH